MRIDYQYKFIKIYKDKIEGLSALIPGADYYLKERLSHKLSLYEDSLLKKLYEFGFIEEWRKSDPDWTYEEVMNYQMAKTLKPFYQEEKR